MATDRSLKVLLQRLWGHIRPLRRVQFGLLLVLMVAASLAEVVSIGLVLPFVGILAVPETVFAHPLVHPVVEAFGIRSAEELVVPLTVLFGAAVLVAGAIRLIVLWASTRISFGAGSELSREIYRRTLYQDYPIHVARHSSEVIDGITKKIDSLIYDTLYPLLTLLASGIVILLILVTLVMVNPRAALAVLLGFGSMYVLVAYATRKRVAANSIRVAEQSRRTVKMLQEGLGGIRDILVDGTQQTFLKMYADADRKLRRAQGSNQIIAASPRFVIEALAILSFIGLAYAMSRGDGGLVAAIPVLATLAVGAQRLLPVMQQGYGAWSNFQGSRASLRDALDLLDQTVHGQPTGERVEPLPFRDALALNGVYYRYGPAMPWVLQGVDLTIRRGSRTGIVGPTGCGKSTLADVIMGLLKPTSGAVAIDGVPLTQENRRSWQARLAHVPQALFLADASIEENIAFGISPDHIDRDRVRRAAGLAQIAGLIESWPDEYRTLVGERGIRISGGQRQRIGIARALYKNADVIVLDEATVALDRETEKKVTQSIEALGDELTVIVIAHQRGALEACDVIVTLADGRVDSVVQRQRAR